MFGAGFDVGTIAGEAGWTPRHLTPVLGAAFAANILLSALLIVDIRNEFGQTTAQLEVPDVVPSSARR